MQGISNWLWKMQDITIRHGYPTAVMAGTSRGKGVAGGSGSGFSRAPKMTEYGSHRFSHHTSKWSQLSIVIHCYPCRYVVPVIKQCKVSLKFMSSSPAPKQLLGLVACLVMNCGTVFFKVMWPFILPILEISWNCFKRSWASTKMWFTEPLESGTWAGRSGCSAAADSGRHRWAAGWKRPWFFVTVFGFPAI